MNDLILLLKIGGSLKEGKAPYEATSGNWKISKDKIKKDQIRYVAGLDNIYKNKVVGVYNPQQWYKIEKGPEKEIGRFYFDGIEAKNEILEKLNKIYDLLLSRFGRGSEKAYISVSELEELLSASSTK
ncbi:hypothetical protein [Ectobacillus funiculus]|uniref:hypothetical protein n=1 Tax=Ectobacillus funiculus TaxID=137993 RepID=UPI00101B8CE8|nr:hypothetical protein [Ectobacillus funiculus]